MDHKSGPGAGCVVVIALLAGLIGGLGGGYYAGTRAASTGGPGELPTLPTTPTSSVKILHEDDAVINSVRAVDPSVVKVVAREEAPRSMMEHYMGAPPRVSEGLGTGFVFEYEDGHQYVLTNSHVVGGAQEILIKFVDGSTIHGELVNQDQEKDIAVVRLVDAPSDLPSVKLGDSSDLEIGQRVLAIGHPFDFEHTVTVGYVSAIGNRQFGQSEWRNVIQTDAAINMGNSGGPLVNLAGEVIGINTLIYSPTGSGNIGLGFAIPINEAKEMLYFLVHGGPWVGISAIMPNSPGFSQYYELPVSDGVVITAGRRSSPADQSGIQPGDVILDIDGKQIANGDDLRSAIFAHRIGDTISFKIARNDSVTDVEVVAGTVNQ